MNILVVDDNPISGRVMESTLQNHGYATLMARDGVQALDQLDSHPEIGLVITDIVMPNVDGKELVRIIKKRRELQDIPVLISTSLKPEEVFRESLPMGGQYFLFKPVKPVSLLQKVKECLNGRQVALCDLDETRAEMGLVPEVFDEIIADFLKIVEDRIGQLEQNYKLYHVTNLREVGEGAQLFRAPRITAVLTRLERATDRQFLPTLVDSVYPLLLRELKALRHYLNLYLSRDYGEKSADFLGTKGKNPSDRHHFFVPWKPLDDKSSS